MKRFIAAFLFLLPIAALAAVVGVYGRVTPILKVATVTGASNTFQFDSSRDGPLRANKVSAGTGAGVGTATVTVEVNDNIANPWITACTLTITAIATSDSCITNAPWPYMRHNITAISGVTVSSTISE